MLETAIRVSEISALTLLDIDLENGILSIDKQYLNQIIGKENHSSELKMIPPKTEASIREVPLSEEAKRAVIRQIDCLEMLDLIGTSSNNLFSTGILLGNMSFDVL
jgi:integrase